MQHNRNFNILVNWVKIRARQTGLPRNVCKVQNDENSNWPTLRDSKPNQMDSKWSEIWNIGSLLWILDILKVASYDTFLGARYSLANTASCRCLIFKVKCRFGNFSKQYFSKWLKMMIYLHGMLRHTKWKVLETLNTLGASQVQPGTI